MSTSNETAGVGSGSAGSELAIGALFAVSGKRVLVTGGSRGIGLMVAHGFVVNGAQVLVTSRKAGAVAAAVEWLQAEALASGSGGSADGMAADVAADDGVAAVAEWVAAGGASLDVLVNNAGTNWAAPLDKYPLAAFDKVMRLNVTAAFALTQALRGALAADGGGAVINIGSINGIKAPNMETYAYSSSKAAVHHLTRHLAGFLADDNIRVNAVAPGPFPSKMMKATLEAFEAAIVAAVPLGRVGAAPDMAGVCLYLASAAANYVTGAVIPVDGGALVGNSSAL